MKKILLFNISLLFLAISMAHSTEIKFNNLSLNDIIKQTAGIEDISKAPKSADNKNVKGWTIMIYMNGKNDLSDYAAGDINEMETVGSLPNANVVVEVGRFAIPQTFYDESNYDFENNSDYDYYEHTHGNPMPQEMGIKKSLTKSDNWSGMRRYLIQKDDDASTITSPLLETVSGDMGNWEHLADFGIWAKKKFPARNYMLIVWSHGDGWKKPGIELNLNKGISTDDTTGNKISTVGLGKALQKMGGVNLYGSDACLMQMTEVVYELKDSAPVIIGSEETEPAHGWPYDKIFTKLQTYPYLRYDWLAKTITQTYAEDYDQRWKDVTLSAIKSQGLSYVKDMINEWVALIPAHEKPFFKEARQQATRFGGSDSKDLVDFLKILSEKTQDQKFKNKTLEIANYITSELIISNSTVGDRYYYAYGLAVYLPAYDYDENYSKLAWAKDTHWDEFLKWLLEE